MNCRRAHELLQQSLDGMPIESPLWLAHLRCCAECRALASAGRRLQDGLNLLAAPLPPPGLAERIAQRVLLERRRARRKARRRWAAGLALAAGLLLAFLVSAFRVQTPTAVPPSEPAAKNAAPSNLPPQSVATRDAPTLRESAAELGEGVSEGLEPVTTSARRAVDLFLRELPMETETN